MARQCTRRFNAVARRSRISSRHQRHLAIDHGVAIAPLVTVHEIFVGANAISQPVLLGPPKGPATAMLDASCAVLPVVGFDVKASAGGCRSASKPTQSLGHGWVGQNVAEGQFGPCGIHHAVQFVPVAGKPRLVHFRGHGPTRRGLEFVSQDDVGMVGEHEVLGRGRVPTERIMRVLLPPSRGTFHETIRQTARP